MPLRMDLTTRKIVGFKLVLVHTPYTMQIKKSRLMSAPILYTMMTFCVFAVHFYLNITLQSK